jgi:beta-carotene 3-hydroxylase
MNIIIALLTFGIMEFVAWSAHKYLMHGWLWNLHEDHHTKTNHHKPFEQNDAFFVIFATPAILCFALGSYYVIPYLIAIGSGISAYGLCYFLVHDIFIHQRIKWFKRSDNFYLRAIRKAHKMHHKHLGKEDGECFGMLLVPFFYFKNELKSK